MKDLNEIVRIEKAIAQKYGEDAIANPKHYWNQDKEKEYLQQLKEVSKKEQEKDPWKGHTQATEKNMPK